jgi:aerobic carbon-monoxide dehydrogenase medium subunit
VTLPPFDLHRAGSVDEARELLTRYGEDAAVVCGGTELLLLLKLGFAAYGHLVDVKGIQELGGISAENGAIVIGASATHREIERSPIVLEQLPALAAMERRVANIRVRNVGTLGGNLCFSDPHSDPATFLLALDAEVEYGLSRAPSANSDMTGDSPRPCPSWTSAPLSRFLVGPYETALQHGELLRAVRVPVPAAGTGVAHRKLAFHERPAATVACLLRAETDVVSEARVAVGSVGPRPVRASAAEQVLTGASVDDGERLAQAAALAAEASGAVEDANGSVEYKEQLVRVLVQRCFRDALASG